MEDFYDEALKAGQRYYRQHVAAGKDPYLPVLNDILPEPMIAAASDAGLMDVPADKIVGTLTEGRSRSFAGNFMPIAKEKTEFSMKWKNLAVSQQEEGIRDAVLLYEYMNHYYVQEGNKRVSVQKYFGVVTILANVRRILPERTSDPKVIAYYEYLDFSRETGIRFLTLTEPGGYEELYRLLGKTAGEKWTEQEISSLRTLYYRFDKIFRASGGSRMQIETGDALLACLQMLGYEYFRNLSDAEMKKDLRKVWEEVLLQEEDRKVEMKLDPEEQGKSMISMLLPSKKLKAAFIYNRGSKNSAWVTNHEMARVQIQEQFGSRLETAVYVCKEQQSAEQEIRQAIEEGADVIFVTSVELISDCLKAAVNTPNVVFMLCTLNKPHRYVRAYYPRMYEAKFITGAIAGACCGCGLIGYIAKYPIYGAMAEINAFARGVKMTNPRAKILLKWAGLKEAGDPLEELKNEGVEMISMLDYENKDKEQGIQRLYGLEKVENGELTPLVLPIWNWSVFYEWILRSMLNRTYRQDQEKTSRSLQYYWGLSSGAVKLLFSESLPTQVRYLGEILTKAVAEGSCRPFFDPELNEEGKPVWDNLDRSLELENILEMETLEDNVIGTIPVYDELTEWAKGLVDICGVQKVRESGAAAAADAPADTGVTSEEENR